MADAAGAAQNLPLANQLLLSPTLQYQLLLHSLLLPLLSPSAPGEKKEGQEQGQDDPLPITVLANQLAITQLNHLVMDFIDKDSHCMTIEKKTPPEHNKELLELLAYHKKLLQLLTKGFKAVQSDMTDANTLLSSVLNTTAADHDSTEALQLRLQDTVSQGFANATHDLANLRRNLKDLVSIHADQLGEYQETVQDAAIHMTRTFTDLIQETTKALREEMVSLVTKGFSSIQADVVSLRVDIQNLQNASALHSQEATELAQVTATGLLQLQAKVSNLTTVLEDAVATFINFTSVVEEEKTNCSHVAEASACPCLFFPVGGECFHVSEEKEVLRWAEARKFCRGVGGDLADPDDVLSLILAIRKHYGEGVGGLWVGGEEQPVDSAPFVSRSDTDIDYDAKGPAPWRWLSGGEVSHGWLRGRPLGPPGVNTCLAISGRGLDSDFCGSQLRYVCEYHRPPPPVEEEDDDDDYDYEEEDYYK